jgi:hypothetical protein
MTRFNPTTPPAKVEGQQDYAALFAKPMVWRLITDGTPYHPDMRLWIADEWGRANEAVTDMFIDVLDRWDVDMISAPVVVGTSNFIPAKSDRAKAVLDRFAMTMWINPPTNSTAEIVAAQLQAGGNNLTIPGDIPSASDLTKARKADFTKQAIVAVADQVEDLKKIVETGLVDDKGKTTRSFGKVNHRRITYWSRLLGCTTALYSGTADFTGIHPKAMEALTSAWTCLTEEEYSGWRTLIGTLVDPAQAAIEEILKRTYEKMNEKGAGLKDKGDIAKQLGAIIQTGLTNLATILEPFDERFIVAQRDLQNELVKYVRGTVERDESPWKDMDDETDTLPF